jgi:hypothetical protein
MIEYCFSAPVWVAVFPFVFMAVVLLGLYMNWW